MTRLPVDITYEAMKPRYENIRQSATTYQAAKIARSNQPNRLQAIVKGIVTFAQGIHSQTTEVTSVSDPVQLGNEQV